MVKGRSLEDKVVWAVRDRPPLQPYTPWARVSHVTAQLPSLDEVSYEAPGRASWFAIFRPISLRSIAEAAQLVSSWSRHVRWWLDILHFIIELRFSVFVAQHFHTLVVKSPGF